jgi:hypothetical protein
MQKIKRLILTPTIIKEVLAIAGLVSIYLIYVGHLFAGDKSFATFQDNTYLILPIFSFISRSFLNGEYPYWINTLVGGIPLYNSPQFSTAYPFYFFQSGLYTTPLDAIRQVHYVTLFHFGLLYLNMYILLRSLKISIIPAILSSTLLAFSPTMFAYTPWVNMAPFAWFPLVMASVILVLQQEHTKTWIIIGSLSAALLVLASASQALIYAVYFSLVLYTYYSFRAIKHRNWSKLGRTSLHLFIMSVMCFILSSPSLVPVLIGTSGMIRFMGDFPPIIGNAKIPFDALLVGQSTPAALGNALIPVKANFLLGNSYIGLIGGFLAFFSVFQTRKYPILLPLIFIAFYALLASTGSHLGIAQINYQLPLLNKIREPGRYLFLFVFCMSILAGFGFEFLAETAKGGIRVFIQRRIIITSLTYLLLTTSVYFIYRSQHLLLIPQRIPFVGLAIFIGLFFLIPYFTGWKTQIILIVMTVIAIFINLKQFPWYAPPLEYGDYFTSENLLSHKVLKEVSKIEDIKNYRIIFEDELDKQHWAMNASYYGLRTFNAYFNPLPYQQFLEMYYQGYQIDNYYELLGAKYILCRSCDSPILKNYHFEKNIWGVSLFDSERALPRYFIINQIAGSYKDRSDFYSKIRIANDFQDKAYIGEESLPSVSKWIGQSVSPLSCVTLDERQSVNELAISVNCDQKAIFVLNEYYSENWKASVNGVMTNTFQINLNQIGLLLNKGANLIELNYRPDLFIGLLWLQRLTLLLLSIYVFITYVWARVFRRTVE